MKKSVKISLALAAVLATPFIVALFVRGPYSVQREIVIEKPQEEVFRYISHLKNQDRYNIWAMADPAMTKTYTGTDGTVGFVYAWSSDEAGKGEMEIKHIIPNERLDLEIRFAEPLATVGQTPFITEALSANSTRVIWSMSGTNPYPLNLMHLFMDSMLGKDLETSLLKLKTELEK